MRNRKALGFLWGFIWPSYGLYGIFVGSHAACGMRGLMTYIFLGTSSQLVTN